MRTIYLVLFILGAVCFLAASFWDARVTDRSGRYINLVALGLLFWILVPLVQTARAL